jgi:putative endonuclease
MKKFYCYIARCLDKTLYTGYCVDLKQREKKHNAGEGARYTRSRLPIKILYWESFRSKSKAMKREAEIKKWSKIKKEVLVKSKRKPL